MRNSLIQDQTPIDIEQIYPGNRLIASVTGYGDVCFIATVAYGTPLAADLNVFRAIRDRALKPNAVGRKIIAWYYRNGPDGARWLEGHGFAKVMVYVGLVAVAVPLKAVMFGHWAIWIVIFLCVLGVFVVLRRKSVSYRRAIIFAGGLAILMVIGYSYFVDVPEARASYTENAKYYYTIDHIGRPMNLRDDDKDLRWYEQHYPFGEIINEETPEGDMTAGAGDYTIAWRPGFRFPGQFQDSSQSAAIHNHYREYLPEFGRYNRVDPIIFSLIVHSYSYSLNNSLIFIDPFALWYIYPTPLPGPDVLPPSQPPVPLPLPPETIPQGLPPTGGAPGYGPGTAPGSGTGLGPSGAVRALGAVGFGLGVFLWPRECGREERCPRSGFVQWQGSDGKSYVVCYYKCPTGGVHKIGPFPGGTSADCPPYIHISY